MPFKVNELYVFVEITEDESEAIVQVMMKDKETGRDRVIPLITASEEMVEKMRGVAQGHANESHNKIKIIKMDNRKEIETIEEQLIQPADDYLKTSS